MSKLIDEIVKEKGAKNYVEIDKLWYICKPMPMQYFWLLRFKNWKVADAIRVLFGKSFAVHYKEDE